MTDLKFHMIEKFYALDNRAIKEHELLKQYTGQVLQAQYAMRELVANGILSFDNLLHALVLTEAGAVIFEEEREYRRKSKRDRAISISAIVAALIPSFFSLIDLIIRAVQFFMSLSN